MQVINEYGIQNNVIITSTSYFQEYQEGNLYKNEDNLSEFPEFAIFCCLTEKGILQKIYINQGGGE